MLLSSRRGGEAKLCAWSQAFVKTRGKVDDERKDATQPLAGVPAAEVREVRGEESGLPQLLASDIGDSFAKQSLEHSARKNLPRGDASRLGRLMRKSRR